MLLDPFPRFLFLPELPLPIYSCPSAPPQPPGQRWERRPGSAGSPEDGRAEQLETTWPEINIQRSEALTCGQYLLQVGEQAPFPDSESVSAFSKIFRFWRLCSPTPWEVGRYGRSLRSPARLGPRNCCCIYPN
ncbi:uncharacterized protein LOC115599830 isoform X3 [Calypte anna]|uniref:uncharacterized protein LOC115599830 isoform X3 n=1 Tax=Calypte anna TaxID=9244 RepID=UPI0011C353AB|nr:uncharacterized protein LOC115599830 isoform X3 [Calypte anna]